MDEKFIYESVKRDTFTVNIPRNCIIKDTNRINRNMLIHCLEDALADSSRLTPSPTAPISINVEMYLPIPKGKALWFNAGAKKGAIPCVTYDGILFVSDLLVPILRKANIINSLQQIHSYTYESTYSVKPRIIITVEKMYQNIGDIKEKCGMSFPKRKEPIKAKRAKKIRNGEDEQ